MKIAIDARIIPTGTGRYIRGLLDSLQTIDTKNEYLILVRAKDINYYKPRNPNFKIIKAEFADYSFGEQFGLARLLYKLKPDLVHFCMPQQPLLYVRPSVTTVHDLNLLHITSNDMGRGELLIKKQIFKVLLWIVAKRSRHIITPTQYVKNDLLRFCRIPKNKITVTYESADKLAAAPTPMTKLKDKPFIMYTGRAEPYKNNRGLIKAHQHLLTMHPTLQLVIVGPMDVLRTADAKWATEQGYKNIIFTGFVPDGVLAWLYTHCQAYVAPSLMEGFGLPGLEAMIHGAPVISSNTTAQPEVYGSAAHYCSPNNTHDMARAINDVITNKKLRQQLIKNGALQSKKYSWRRMAEQTLARYGDL